MISVKKLALWICVFFVSLPLVSVNVNAQYSISGTVTDADTGEYLIGGNVIIPGLGIGSTTNLSGEYTISDLPAGTYQLQVKYVGYLTANETVTISDGSVTKNISVQFDPSANNTAISQSDDIYTHDDEVSSIAITQDGMYAYSGSYDRTVKKWVVETGELIRSYSIESEVLAIDISPDGRLLAVGDDYGKLTLWDTQTGSKLRSFDEHDCEIIWDVEFSPDGNTLLSAGDDFYIRTWSVSSGSLNRIFESHDDEVFAARFSSDGRFIVSASADETAKLWNASTGSLIRTFEGHYDWVNTVDISSDGKMLLTGSDDSQIILWDTSTGRKIHTIENGDEYIYYLEFSPDDVFFISVSDNYDDAIRLFTVESGEALASYTGHSDELITAVFTPDGDHFLSGAYDYTMRYWSLSTLSAIRIFGD
jgi:WD40 repeat protein